MEIKFKKKILFNWIRGLNEAYRDHLFIFVKYSYQSSKLWGYKNSFTFVGWILIQRLNNNFSKYERLSHNILYYVHVHIYIYYEWAFDASSHKFPPIPFLLRPWALLSAHANTCMMSFYHHIHTHSTLLNRFNNMWAAVHQPTQNPVQ